VSDGLFLITHSGRMTSDFSGRHGKSAWRVVDAEASGWSRERIEHGLACSIPDCFPPRPEKIVTVLGRQDRITPFASGLSLVDSGACPTKPLRLDRGHFSMPLTMIRNPAPVAVSK
jgi:hypothetical protein